MSSGNFTMPDRRDLFLWSEELSLVDYIVARYRVTSLVGAEETAVNMAMEQSAATLKITGYVEPDTLASATIRVLSAVDTALASSLSPLRPYNLPTEVYARSDTASHPRSFEITLAFPRSLLIGKASQLLNVIVGELPRLGFLTAFSLLDAPLPEEFGPGPAFGTEAILASFKTQGPVLCRSMRPAVGLDTETMARLNRDVLSGGFHAVKDDELAVFANLADFRSHLEAMIQARDEAIEVTGEPKWYIANLLCEPNELPERFELAVELGVNAVLVAPFIQGLGVLPWLARQKRLPILAHNSGSDLLTRNPEWGISHETAASWLRSLGADWVVTPGGFASSDQPDDEEKTFIDACTRSQSIRPTMPILQGGKEPAGLCGYTRSVGNSAYMLIVASWIDRHEEGMMRGAQYFRRAVDHSGGKEG